MDAETTPWYLRIGFPYDYSRNFEGFWGQKTVTLNFCEEDYVVSYYIAEVCNTLTNLLFLWLGIKGIRNCLAHGHDRVFLVSYLGYLLVGAGSSAFHATLKYPMQLVDELSMIYTTCVMVFATFSYSKSPRFAVSLGIGLVFLAGFITVYYHQTKSPLFHQSSYAILTATVVFRSLYIMEAQLRPAMATRNPETGHRIIKTMWKMVGIGLSVFLMGFLIWNLDNFFCGTVIHWRRQVGLPWAMVLEGHAWWHLMTGLAYYYIVWGIWLRWCLEGREDEYQLIWPRYLLSIPEVVRVDKRKD